MFVFSGAPGEKDRTGISHESFLLMANSQSDMEEWVRAIRRVIWAPLGGGLILKHKHKCWSKYSTVNVLQQKQLLMPLRG